MTESEISRGARNFKIPI